MINQIRTFGSGKVQIGAVGAALTDAANLVGDVQSVSIDMTSQKKELMNSPEISIYPVAVKYYGNKVEVKLSFENINYDVIARTTGGTAATAGGITTVTLTATSTPGYFKCVIATVDLNDNPVLITLNNASAPGLSLMLALDDYGKSEVTISGYPDGAGIVATIAGPQGV